MSGTIAIAVIFFVLGLVASFLIVGCASGPSSENVVSEYHAALSSARKIPAPAAGSDLETESLERWKVLLADLASESIGDNVKEVYSGNLYFNDTLKTIRSAEDLAAHFEATAEILDTGTVKYLSETRDASGDLYIRWEMSYSGKKINDGKPIVTIGMSQLRFDEAGKVVFHQDFWDSTAGIFEHLPVVGGPIKFFRNRM